MCRRLVARSDTRTSQQLSAAAASVAADVEVVPVAAAGNAVRLCVIFFAGGLIVARLQSVSVLADAVTHSASTIRNRTVKRMF